MKAAIPTQLNSWFGNSFFKRPLFSRHSTVKGLIVYSGSFRPFTQGKTNTIKFKESCASFISFLLNRRRPFTIFSAVVLINVLAIQCIFGGWLFPHISKKVFKLTPFFAKPYSSRSVMLVGITPRIKASRFHSIPSCIFGGSAKAVFFIFKPYQSVLLTTTGLRFFKIAPVYSFEFSALTSAYPHTFPCVFNNRQEVKLFSS